MEQQIIGLDVSKGWLDGYLPANGRRLRVGNHAQGVAELVGALGDPAGCLVVLEASGGYERTAHQALVAQGVPAAIVNPKRVRDFAKASGLLAKTDRVDARLIARYGAVMRPAATALPDPARLELREILAIGPLARSPGGMSAQLTAGASWWRRSPPASSSSSSCRARWCGRGWRKRSPACSRRPRSS